MPLRKAELGGGIVGMTHNITIHAINANSGFLSNKSGLHENSGYIERLEL